MMHRISNIRDPQDAHDAFNTNGTRNPHAPTGCPNRVGAYDAHNMHDTDSTHGTEQTHNHTLGTSNAGNTHDMAH